MRAHCRTLGDYLFFAPPSETPRNYLRRERAAKRTCSRCPVRLQCLNFALENHESDGIWGGNNPSERAWSAPLYRVCPENGVIDWFLTTFVRQTAVRRTLSRRHSVLPSIGWTSACGRCLWDRGS
ncbi:MULTISPECIES: WhiB family transcriptional regulator [Rhodococcus]|uniref:WhiB family transcriptional regulator n=1 Tax=Rhodococcus TaxID=1827 RepID=UPI001F149CB7|nr:MULTISPECIES: WhiB family transcriptional regulator [Rhodococcus]